MEVVRGAMNSDDAQMMRRAAEDLERALQQVGQAIYGSDSAARASDQYGQEPRGETPPPPESGTVEGEFREI
jgi:hypothetical protein